MRAHGHAHPHPINTIAHFNKNKQVGSQSEQVCPIVCWLANRAGVSPSIKMDNHGDHLKHCRVINNRTYCETVKNLI